MFAEWARATSQRVLFGLSGGSFSFSRSLFVASRMACSTSDKSTFFGSLAVSAATRSVTRVRKSTTTPNERNAIATPHEGRTHQLLHSTSYAAESLLRLTRDSGKSTYLSQFPDNRKVD